MNTLQNGVSQYASMLVQRGHFSSVQIKFERRTAVSWQATTDPFPYHIDVSSAKPWARVSLHDCGGLMICLLCYMFAQMTASKEHLLQHVK